jgi:hypothetical protein
MSELQVPKGVEAFLIRHPAEAGMAVARLGLVADVLAGIEAVDPSIGSGFERDAEIRRPDEHLELPGVNRRAVPVDLWDDEQSWTASVSDQPGLIAQRPTRRAVLVALKETLAAVQHVQLR